MWLSLIIFIFFYKTEIFYITHILQHGRELFEVRNTFSQIKFSFSLNLLAEILHVFEALTHYSVNSFL